MLWQALFAFRLLATCCRMLCMVLAMYIMGKVAQKLVISGTSVCIGLLGNFGTLCSNIFAFLGQLVNQMTLAGQLCLMQCILVGVSRFALRSVAFGAIVHFQTPRLFESLYVGLDRLIWHTLVHGGGHERGHPKLYRYVFCCGA